MSDTESSSQPSTDGSTIEPESEINKIHADDFIRPMENGEEREQLENSIQDQWKEFIMKARSGDLRALQVLSSGTRIMPPTEAFGFCEMLYFHFQSALPHDNESGEDITPVEQLAIVAVYALGDMLDRFAEEDLAEQVRISWSTIARWLLFFERKFLDNDAADSWCLASSMAFLLAKATMLSGLKGRICSNLDILKLLAVLWSDKDKLNVDGRGYASRALSQCDTESIPNLRRMLINLVMKNNHSVSFVVVSKLLSRISNASGYRESTTDWVTLDAYARVLMFFSYAPPERAGCIQLEFNIREGVDLIELINERHLRFITLFIYTFEQSYGPTLAGNVIISGFLTTLLEFSPFLVEKSLKSTFSGVLAGAITKTLPRYVGIYSLLEIFKEYYLDRCSKEAREKIKGSPVANEWALFDGFLFERLAYKALFDNDQDKEELPAGCGNLDCENNDETDSFQTCSVCKAVRYCSKECQLIAWKQQGHKQRCKKKDPDSKEEKNDAFVHYCIRRDVIRHLPGLRELAKRKLKDVDFNLIGFAMNYTKLPIKFEIYRLQSLLDLIAGLQTLKDV